MASWEDEADEILEAEEREKREAAEREAAKQKAQALKQKKQGFQNDQSDAPLSDPLAEKMRRQKLVEEADKRLMDDLFAGCERPADYSAPSVSSTAAAGSSKPQKAKTATQAVDPFEAINLRSYKDCEQFAQKLSRKIQESPAKSPAWLRLLDLILKDCTPKMDMKDLVSLQNKVQQSVAAKDKEMKQLAEKKKKPNDVGSKIKNYQDEMDLLYGDLSGEEEDEDEDDGEAFI
ncbi:translation initiation factor eif3 subunit [Cystoisospora suis]|uniref:Translation initiation factor eif3 subunit n=1 Tax=Cystoisospora suis TaxID=483139 RepID=A0A2C6LFP8_9APIC|nr:translation initiation factor eif3 subunit [Cystoisospora suis]